MDAVQFDLLCVKLRLAANSKPEFITDCDITLCTQAQILDIVQRSKYVLQAMCVYKQWQMAKEGGPDKSWGTACETVAKGSDYLTAPGENPPITSATIQVHFLDLINNYGFFKVSMSGKMGRESLLFEIDDERATEARKWCMLNIRTLSSLNFCEYLNSVMFPLVRNSEEYSSKQMATMGVDTSVCVKTAYSYLRRLGFIYRKGAASYCTYFHFSRFLFLPYALRLFFLSFFWFSNPSFFFFFLFS